jgi:uncharacterized protein YjbI with pentapeptide repeats
MSDTGRVALESETPVNPYGLLDAVNSASAIAHTAWLIFIALMAYLLVAVSAVTHKDLLLETPVALPILQVHLRQTQFFLFIPVLVVLFHLGVLSQLVLLARKTLAFDAAVRALELANRRNHPLRLELHTFFFTQAVAGPHRSLIVSAFLHGLSRLTLVVLPVFLLLYIQIVFLPYHDTTMTWTHRAALVVDIALLILIGVFLTRAETSFLKAVWRATLEHPLSVTIIAGALALLIIFSFFVATVPGERLDRISQVFLGVGVSEPDPPPPRVIAGLMTSFSRRTDGLVLGLFHRNLIVTDQDLVPGKDAATEGASINLRGRDLRYARFDRTDLQRADLTGADLGSASFVAADLRKARLQCADLSELLLRDDRKGARCASARGANFAGAKLAGARMAGVDLRDALFEEANLEAAELTAASLAGANFSNAHLEKADLTGAAQLQGANFRLATLQGADLTGVQAHFADFSSASMQGAVLTRAQLHGAVLRDAHLDGSDLFQVKLNGADLTGAKMRGVDLRRAGVWETLPPQSDRVHLADMTELVLKPLDESDLAGLSAMLDKLDNDRLRGRVKEALGLLMDQSVAGLSAMLEKLDNARLRGRVKEALGPLMNPSAGGSWAMSQEHQRWQSHVMAASPADLHAYKIELTEYLARLMCHSRWSNGAVATGIAKRAQAPQFRGDMMTIHDRLKSPECAAAETVSKKAFRDLALAIDKLRPD